MHSWETPVRHDYVTTATRTITVTLTDNYGVIGTAKYSVAVS